MINLISQRKNSLGQILLHKSGHALAKIFVTTGQTRLLTVDQLMQFIDAYPHDDMSLDMKRELLIQLSDSAFKETPVQSPNSMSRWNKQLEEQETDSEQGTQPDRQSRSEVETSKPVSAEKLKNMLDYCIYCTDPASNPTKESVQQEQILQTYVNNMEKKLTSSRYKHGFAASIPKGEHRKSSSCYDKHLLVHRRKNSCSDSSSSGQ